MQHAELNLCLFRLGCWMCTWWSCLSMLWKLPCWICASLWQKWYLKCWSASVEKYFLCWVRFPCHPCVTLKIFLSPWRANTCNLQVKWSFLRTQPNFLLIYSAKCILPRLTLQLCPKDSMNWSCLFWDLRWYEKFTLLLLFKNIFNERSLWEVDFLYFYVG